MVYGERFNTISHLIGFLFAVLGTAVLVVIAAQSGDPWKITSCAIYGSMLMVLYGSSTLYHGVQGGTNQVFQKWDHCSIYLLIAGSYMPFALVTLRGPWGWTLFGVIWALALLGIAQEIWLPTRTRALSMLLYVLMGWLALVAILPLWHALTPAGFGGLLAGGACYTLGIVFYATGHRVRHGHGIWHLFVLAGSTCHFFTVLLFVA
jgi:hemolysin III